MENRNITTIFVEIFFTEIQYYKIGFKNTTFLMLSKNQRQLIRQLQQKKFRNEKKLFIVEGKKSIEEFLSSHFQLEILFHTTDFWQKINSISSEKRVIISAEELQSISFLTNPDQGIAIFRIPKQLPIRSEGFMLALDDIRDPGNLGTIIRLCDWFSVSQIICSRQSVDCFNPKVVQATMGSLTRVSVVYTDLREFLQNTDLPVFASVLNGENVYKKQLPSQGILVLGNEANGISPEIIAICSEKITIPQFGNQKTESLNVAMASAILLSEFKRFE